MALIKLETVMTNQEAVAVQNINNNYVQSEIEINKTDLIDTNTTVSAKADKIYVDTALASLASGSPKNTFATLALLNADTDANTTDGRKFIYVVSADGKWYRWGGTTWVIGGTYQSTGIADASVTSTKLSSTVTDTIRDVNGIKLEYGKNHYNKATSLVNTLLQSNGTTYAPGGTSWYTSDYIQVNPLQPITMLNARFVCEFDLYKTFISGTFIDNNPGITTTVTTNVNTFYVRYSFLSTYVNTNQLEYGSTTTRFENFIQPTLIGLNGLPITVPSTPETVVKIGGKNRFDKSVLFADNIIGSTGVIGTIGATGFTTTDFMDVTASTQVAINKARYVAEYDKYKTFIAGTYQDITPEIQTVFTTNEITAYIRVTTASSNISKLQVEYNSEPSQYEACYYSVYFRGINIFDYKGSDTVTNLLSSGDYTKYVDREKYQIWKNTGLRKIQAVLRDISVQTTGLSIGSSIEVSTTGINGLYSNTVLFNSTNFANLITGSTIAHIILNPWSRQTTSTPLAERTGSNWRMVVITSLGQVYHNFPSRATTYDGVEVAGDIIKFDESVIWDLPERKYPSTNTSATGVEQYKPGLPTDRYNYYPTVNASNAYSNGGFANSKTIGGKTFPRFYQPGRTLQTNSMTFMGGFESDHKVSVLGTYLSNTTEAARICLFMSDDGGRSWFNKYEYTTQKAVCSTAFNTSTITENYVTNSFNVKKRILTIPSIVNKEPSTIFTLGTSVDVFSISKATQAVITTNTPHGFVDGDVVAFKTNSACAGFNWLTNDAMFAGNAGNGVWFGVKVIDVNSFYLYEYANSVSNNISARHIHYINRVKDGWLFGTGETYPDGFIFYMQMMETEGYENRYAYQDFSTYRLTSTSTAMQRLLGADMKDDIDSTMIVAMDTDLISRGAIALPSGRTDSIHRSSTGIFKGKLSDIDNINNYSCIYEAKQVAYFFKKKGGAYIFCGQEGEFAMSFDNGATWETEDLGELIQHFTGESKKFIVTDNFVIVIK